MSNFVWTIHQDFDPMSYFDPFGKSRGLANAHKRLDLAKARVRLNGLKAQFSAGSQFAAFQEWRAGSAAKSADLLDDSHIEGLACRFGDAENTDSHGCFFTPETQFYEKYLVGHPILYNHADYEPMAGGLAPAAKSVQEIDALSEFDDALKSMAEQPVIGQVTGVKIDPLGLWVQGELFKAKKYTSYILAMIKRGILKISSDSAQHLIKTELQPNGAVKYLRFPLAAVSLTSHPAEFRLDPVQAVKSCNPLWDEPPEPAKMAGFFWPGGSKSLEITGKRVTDWDRVSMETKDAKRAKLLHRVGLRLANHRLNQFKLSIGE